MRYFIKVTTLLITLCLSIGITQAAATDAGSLQQQIDREREIALPKQSAPVEAEPQPLKTLSGEAITVKKFTFAGNTLLTSEELNQVVASYLNRPLSFAQLQQAAIAVANAYREAGWIVRAYLPKQDITEGTVIIQIVEAVFGGVRLEGVPTLRLKPEQILGGIDYAQVTREPINASKLERAILLLDDLPGITVASSLQKGIGQNETELVLKVADEPLIKTEISADNAGSYSTGAERLSGNFSLNSPLGIGDQATANLMHSSGNDYARLVYSVLIRLSQTITSGSMLSICPQVE